MSDYDQLNARIKGMSSHLLTEAFYEQILAVPGQEGLVDALLNSPYGPALRESLQLGLNLTAVERGLRYDLSETANRIFMLAPQRPRRLLEIQMRWPDMKNVLTLLRGKATGASSEDTMAGMLSGGTLDEARLMELAREPDALAMVNTLSVWDFPLAHPLKQMGPRIRDRHALVEAENALVQAYFDWAWDTADGRDENSTLIREFVRQQIDLMNVLICLRRVRQQAQGTEVPLVALLPHGRLERRVLDRMRRCRDLDDALEILAGTYFESGVERGILAFGEHRRLRMMERFLEHVVLATGCRMFRLDPLGIGVASGYLWRKFNEFLNLRILLRGKTYQRPTAAIREELLIV
ncbi:MAG: V-type ATPase subunit [Phycisphaerae bacterium]|nr:V-type ATPase subunit [Phycisphaerae bacterium]